MAGPDDVDIDIVGHDHTERAFRSVERGLKRLGGSMGTATRTMAKAGAMVASFSSLLGPTAIGLTKVVTATAHATATMGPLVALLPSMAAGLVLIKGTAAIVGPAMARSFTPVTDLFGDEKTPGPLRRGIEAAATKDLPALARSFAKVNMPAIGGAMKDIAGSMNGVVRGIGKWVNSREGMSVIANVTEATAMEFRLLGPHITAAAIALGRLTGRGSDGITYLFIGITKLIDGFTRWANSMTDSKIGAALEAAQKSAGTLGEKLRMVKDVFAWIAENPNKIKAMSDALAGVGIALGLAGGAWVAVVAGAVTLISNHWDTLKPKFEAAAKWANATWDAIANDPNVQRIWAAIETIGRAIRDDFVAAWGLVAPKLKEFGSAAQEAWSTVGPFIARVLENPDVRNGLRVMAIGLAAVAAAMIVVSAVTASTAAAVIGGLAGMAAYMVGTFVRTVFAAVGLALTAFGQFAVGLGGVIKHIPGLGGVGRALEKAGNDALGAAGKVQELANRLNNVRSKAVTVTVTAVGNGVNLIQRSNSNVVRYQSKGGSGVQAFASGGIVKARPGGTLARIGEAGQDEAVIPMARNGTMQLASVGGGGGGGMVVNLTVNVTQPLGDPRAIAAAVQNAFASAGAGGMSLRPMAQAIARAS